jgi:Ni/Fe-hydrogenase 1 B-type cytochrome subunit
MYAAMSQSWLPHRFAWVVPLMGGDFAVRQWHHAMMWFFIIFAIIHVYLVFYHDYVEGRGVISSMAGGWKYIEDPDHRKE